MKDRIYTVLVFICGMIFCGVCAIFIQGVFHLTCLIFLVVLLLGCLGAIFYWLETPRSERRPDERDKE